MGRREVFVPPLTLDRASAIPLRRQIAQQIGQAIRSGAIPHDARLPSTRVTARLLRVSRNTVLAAYDDLAAEDLVRGDPGSGIRVHHSAPAREPSWFGLRQVIQAAGYPAKVLALEDPDGNPLYLRR